MISDLATCEWNPGINRSIVSIEIAAKRVRPEDRSLLISRFNAKSYNDQVTIQKDQITGTAQYSALITNMNFGSGRVCKKVTRKKWKPSDAVSAIVFWINGRAYGYASACGNLFELGLLHSPKQPELPAVQVFDRPTTIGEPFGPIYNPGTPNGSEGSSPYSPFQSDSIYAGSFTEFAGNGYGGGYYYGGGIGTWIGVPPEQHYGPSAPIPELPVWSYLGIGAALLTWRKYVNRK